LNILITGGAGFIGHHISNKLVNQGHYVRILDSLAPQIHGNIPVTFGWLAHPRIDFIRGSILDRQTVVNAIAGITHIIHLASETGTGQSMYEISKYNNVNSQGTAILLDVLSNSPDRLVEKFLLASSRSVYGEGAYTCSYCEGSASRQYPISRSYDQLKKHQWEPICPNCKHPLISLATKEDDSLLPASVYAATKLAQEDLVRICCNSLDIDHVILRLQNVYGEGQSLHNPYTGILSIFSTRIRHGLPLPIFEDGLETRDFVHVDDVADAFVLCLNQPEQMKVTLNIGSGIGTPVLEVAQQLVDSLGSSVSINITADFRIGDIRHNKADISRAVGLLGYAPQIDLTEGLKRFSQWASTQPLPEDNLEHANNELRERKLMP
jgi:dTDP-L-rhamnose 4-epimerase